MEHRNVVEPEPVPQELINLLIDEDDEVDENEGMLEEISFDDEEGEVNVLDMPVLIAAPGGSLQRIWPDGDGNQLSTPLAGSGDESTDSDDEWEQAHRNIEEPMSPLSSPARSSDPAPAPAPASAPATAPASAPATTPASASATTPASASATGPAPKRFRIEILEPVTAIRGRASTRGRGRGRGASRRLGGGATFLNERRWMRGDELEQMYINDLDLPLDIQEKIHAHLSSRNRNARRRMNDDLEKENEENERDAEGFNVNEDFLWRGMDEWQGERCAFRPEATGPTHGFDNPYEAMHAIWTDEIMAHIAHESNRYAESVLSVRRPRFIRDWFQTNLHEIWTLFAFWIMLGIIRMPSIKSCFTKNPLLKTDIFRKIFTEGRYWNVNAAFHLVEGTDPSNPLHPMGPIIIHLNNKFQELYRLDQEICIDESLTLWKGPVGFKQYIKTKAARFGIKTYELCESATGYLWAFFVYVGRASGTGNSPSSVSTVLRLIQPILNLGHTLYMDNWFNSPSLARWLKRHNTDCVGTLRSSRKGVPEAIKQAPLQEGQFIARASDDVMVLAIQDRKRVTCISTYHDVSQVHIAARQGRPAQHRLSLINDYNKAMGGVDRLDSMLEAYLVERKQCKNWNKKLFKRLLNISIQNARIICEKSTNTKIDALAFRIKLVEEIITRHLPHVPHRPAPAQHRRNPTFPLGRLTERHFIRRILITDEMRAAVAHRTNLGRRNCVWCTYNYRRATTVYECAECGLALCLPDCFREFHTTS